MHWSPGRLQPVNAPIDVASRRWPGWPGFAFSPNGKAVLLCDEKQGRVCDIITGKMLGRPLRGVDWASYEDGGETLLTANSLDIRRWQAARTLTGRELGFSKRSSHSNKAFSPDGKTIAMVAYEASNESWEIQFWDRSTCGLTGEPILGANPDLVAYSPDGKVLLCLSGVMPPSVQLWDTSSRRLIGKPVAIAPLGNQFPNIPFPFAFRSDSKQLVFADGKMARILDTTSGKLVGKPLNFDVGDGLRRHVESLAFSPDDKRIAAGDSDGMIKVWNTDTGKEVVPFPKGLGFPVLFAAFSLDNKTLITHELAQPVQVWNVETGKRLIVPIPHIFNNRYRQLCLSPDGKTILTRTDNDTARLWDVETGQPRSCRLQHRQITEMAFSPDGRLIVTDWDRRFAVVGCRHGGTTCR